MEANLPKGKLGGYLILIGGILFTSIFIGQFYTYFDVTNWEILWRLVWLFIAIGFTLFAGFAAIKKLNKIGGLISFIENIIIACLTFFLVFETWNIPWYDSWLFYIYLWGFIVNLIGSILAMMNR
ncbi:MAG: hypothetical protein GF329_21855 [Candidatus Lokiarchaeota archaeon]|nr:hypothetical protein [Candidatus Lokiarchaeota archaeon]